MKTLILSLVALSFTWILGQMALADDAPPAAEAKAEAKVEATKEAKPVAEKKPAKPEKSNEKKGAAKVVKYKDVTKLKKDEMKAGTGTEAKSGNTVSVHYTGWLVNGTKFDSSVDRGQPFSFHLGKGEVIPGWDQGVQGMKVGGKRRLHIPSSLGYGPNGAPPVIPPNATLIFEVELLDVKA